VVALIAYERPEQSPLAHLLQLSQRELVADVVNAAILQVAGQSAAAAGDAAGAAAADSSSVDLSSSPPQVRTGTPVNELKKEVHVHVGHQHAVCSSLAWWCLMQTCACVWHSPVAQLLLWLACQSASNPPWQLPFPICCCCGAECCCCLRARLRCCCGSWLQRGQHCVRSKAGESPLTFVRPCSALRRDTWLVACIPCMQRPRLDHASAKLGVGLEN
jgi:hypothetical protein